MEKNKNDIRHLRILRDKFFEGIIAPDELEVLHNVAREVSSGKVDKGLEPDYVLVSDLKIIDSMRGLAEKAASKYAENAPVELEKKLEQHIHSLALHEKPTPIKERVLLSTSLLKRILAYSVSAAAVVGLFFTSYHILNEDTGLGLPDSKNHIAKAFTPAPASSPVSLPAPLSPVMEPAENSGTKTHQATDRQEKEVLIAEEPSTPQFPEEEQEIEDFPALFDNNDHFEEEEAPQQENFLDAEPSEKSVENIALLIDSIDPMALDPDLLSTPMSCLTAGIGNVYHSLSFVTETLSSVLQHPGDTPMSE